MLEIPSGFFDSTLLLFVLLNPFLLCIYLLDLIESLDRRTFRSCLIRGALISFTVFALFGWFGDAIFSRVLQVRFAAFLIFGGSIFFVVGIRYVMVGSDAIRSMRGTPQSIAGSIAMPFLIGPGTISASVLAGSKLDVLWAILAIATALTVAIVGVLVLKNIHDMARKNHQPLVDRYIDIVGRVSALVIGTIAIEMILQGFELWYQELPG